MSQCEDSCAGGECNEQHARVDQVHHVVPHDHDQHAYARQPNTHTQRPNGQNALPREPRGIANPAKGIGEVARSEDTRKDASTTNTEVLSHRKNRRHLGKPHPNTKQDNSHPSRKERPQAVGRRKVGGESLTKNKDTLRVASIAGGPGVWCVCPDTHFYFSGACHCHYKCLFKEISKTDYGISAFLSSPFALVVCVLSGVTIIVILIVLYIKSRRKKDTEEPYLDVSEVSSQHQNTTSSLPPDEPKSPRSTKSPKNHSPKSPPLTKVKSNSSFVSLDGEMEDRLTEGPSKQVISQRTSVALF